ncbi:MAG: hypothetical protein WBD11_10125 [Xanthobacteraceae bacterium]|jgi:hypothetical protein
MVLRLIHASRGSATAASLCANDLRESFAMKNCDENKRFLAEVLNQRSSMVGLSDFGGAPAVPKTGDQ